MSNATELRNLLKAKVAAMPTGMLMQATDDLDARKSRDVAESMVFVLMSADLAGRLRDMAREHSTESLIDDVRKHETTDYVAASKSQRATYWAMLEVLEERFPAAYASAEEWLDTLDTEQIKDGDGNLYSRRLLELIEAEQVAA
jgi:hypothetical protein